MVKVLYHKTILISPSSIKVQAIIYVTVKLLIKNVILKKILS